MAIQPSHFTMAVLTELPSLELLRDDDDTVCRFDAYHNGVRGNLCVTRSAFKWSSVGLQKVINVCVPMNAIIATNLGGADSASIQVELDDGRVFSFGLLEKEHARMTLRALSSPTSPARALRHRRRVSFRRRARASAVVDPAEEAAARRVASPVLVDRGKRDTHVLAFSDDDDNSGGYDEKSETDDDEIKNEQRGMMKIPDYEEMKSAAGRITRRIIWGEGSEWWKRHALDVVVCGFALVTLVFAIITIILADVFVFQVRLLGVTVASLGKRL